VERHPTTRLVIVVSETMARTFWPAENAIGKRIKLGRPQDSSPWLEVVALQTCC
jgi:hypothetical protein